MNQLLKNLLTIHLIISDVEKFVNIKIHMESLDTSREGYKAIVEDTDTLIRMLNQFSKSSKVFKRTKPK